MQLLSLKSKCRLVGLLLLGCSVISANIAWASDRHLLWQSRDQFVALVSIEQGVDGPNEHPVNMAPETLTELLAALDMRTEHTTGTEPLFTEESRQTLVPYLHKALSTAKPQQDVTFAVIGLYRSLRGLTKSPRVTTGRIFYRDGRLNLIFGMVQQDFNEREDRRLAPFTPGSRKQASAGTWRIVQQPGQDLFILKRNDWLVFTDTPPLPTKAPEQQKEVMPLHTPPTATAPPPPPRTTGEQRSPVERLTTLKELRDKGLISDEEYQGKRQQILNDL